ncbi:hypothetical protein [Desulfonatronum thioautotrophicum]|uniref:hypothetical protein n=1 Tax=Desulfonatronum thioautotrophicum TaxID=617001 RepID=UPI0005EAEF7A|nr:hypothetical protein [Desulfonatronum thioautotrophicum]
MDENTKHLDSSKKNKKIRTLSLEEMEAIVDDCVKVGESLEQGESINVNNFCEKHNIVTTLFYQIIAEAGLKTGKAYPYEFNKEKLKLKSILHAVVGKKGNIIVKPPIVEKLNKEREDVDKFMPGDVLSIENKGNAITLKKM